jgi:hypothetical protein
MVAPADQYEYWVHKRSGTIYAVRVKAGAVTGACGPLDLDTAMARENPSGLEYREATWMEEHREEFAGISDWLRGRF